VEIIEKTELNEVLKEFFRCFNLSSKGHGDCLKFVKSFGIPMLVLGGGGYTLRNVARVWTYETAILLHTDLTEELPYNDYIENYGPDYTLHIPSTNMESQNTKDYLERFKNRVLENIRRIGRPSGGTHESPPDAYPSDDQDDQDPDLRPSDKRPQRDDELSDSDEEDERRNTDDPNEEANHADTPKEESNQDVEDTPMETDERDSPSHSSAGNKKT